MNEEKEKPANRENTSGRNPDGTFMKGVSGNPNGRPKGSLKDYVRQKLSEMTLEEKEKFLETIPREVVWKMGEGNPTNEVVGDLNIKVEKLEEIQKATKDILGNG